MTPTAPDISAGLLLLVIALVTIYGLFRPTLRPCARCGEMADPRGACTRCWEVQG